MLVDHFPILGLRVTGTNLELRLPEPEELSTLADLAAEGVHDPNQMPFAFPWTDMPPAERARSVVQHHWRNLSEFRPEQWNLPLAVFRDGEPVGLQNMVGVDFATIREVGSGSWLGLRFQGQGIGTRMRSMMLHLAFAGLGAEAANTEAFDTNPASNRVTEKNGYLPNGVGFNVARGVKTRKVCYRLPRDSWELSRGSDPIDIHGLEPCLPMFGVGDPAAT